MSNIVCNRENVPERMRSTEWVGVNVIYESFLSPLVVSNACSPCAEDTPCGKPQSGFVASRDVRNLPVILIYYHTSPNGRSYASWKVSSNLEKERLVEILG